MGARWNRLAVAVVAAVLVLLGAGVGAAAPAPWEPVAVPQLQTGQDNLLLGDGCPNATFCMAVGFVYDGGASVPLVETFNGRAWSLRHPIKVGFASFFDQVSCLSATDCTVIGNTRATATSGIPEPLAEHWDGRSWRLETPVGASGGGALITISCPSPSMCMAAGNTLKGRALIERWGSGGQGWKVLTPPTLSLDAELNGLSCVSDRHCVAVGSFLQGENTGGNLVEVWNGTRWTETSVPSPSSGAALGAVSCTSTTACVAVGQGLEGPASSLVLHESTWSVHVPTQAMESQLLGVMCRSAASCTAVGTVNDGSAQRAAVEHWNGSSWSTRTVIQPGTDASLYAVSCPTRSTCFAAGNYTPGTPGADSWIHAAVERGPST